MAKLSLRDRLMRYLLKQHGWVASGDLQRLVVAHTSYTPRTAVRRLEELAEEGKLQVEYRKGHAFYKAKSAERTAQMTIVEKFDAGLPAEIVFST